MRRGRGQQWYKRLLEYPTASGLANEGEVSFRVCGALAIVLHPNDPVARSTLFRNARELYKARSTVVHGGKEPPPQEAAAYRGRAVEIAVRTFRAIHAHPHLLRAADSTIRSRLALLGF